MPIRFFFDVEAQDLQKEGFAFGYVVVSVNESNEFKVLEQGEYYSIIGAQGAGSWVKHYVIPSLTMLNPYLPYINGNMPKEMLDRKAFPEQVVLTIKELRDKFYEIYMKWKKEGAEFWSDVNYPVETNFLHALILDGNGARDWEMPYPLRDLSAFVAVEVDRNEYSGLPGLRKHNPLDDSLASAYALYKYETELLNKDKSKELSQNSEKTEPNLAASLYALGSPVFKTKEIDKAKVHYGLSHS